LGAVGMHWCCTFLDPEFSSGHSWPTCMLIIFQIVSHCAKRLCHLNTAVWPNASLLYTCMIFWNISLEDVSHFW
jgi:hypothetical protein